MSYLINALISLGIATFFYVIEHVPFYKVAFFGGMLLLIVNIALHFWQATRDEQRPENGIANEEAEQRNQNMPTETKDE